MHRDTPSAASSGGGDIIPKDSWRAKHWRLMSLFVTIPGEEGDLLRSAGASVVAASSSSARLAALAAANAKLSEEDRCVVVQLIRGVAVHPEWCWDSAHDDHHNRSASADNGAVSHEGWLVVRSIAALVAAELSSLEVQLLRMLGKQQRKATAAAEERDHSANVLAQIAQLAMSTACSSRLPMATPSAGPAIDAGSVSMSSHQTQANALEDSNGALRETHVLAAHAQQRESVDDAYVMGKASAPLRPLTLSAAIPPPSAPPLSILSSIIADRSRSNTATTVPSSTTVSVTPIHHNTALSDAAIPVGVPSRNAAIVTRPCDICEDESGDLMECADCKSLLHEACGGPHPDDALRICRTCRRAIGLESDSSELNSETSSDERVTSESGDSSLSGFIVRSDEEEEDESDASSSTLSASSSEESVVAPTRKRRGGGAAPAVRKRSIVRSPPPAAKKGITSNKSSRPANTGAMSEKPAVAAAGTKSSTPRGRVQQHAALPLKRPRNDVESAALLADGERSRPAKNFGKAVTNKRRL